MIRHTMPSLARQQIEASLGYKRLSRKGGRKGRRKGVNFVVIQNSRLGMIYH